MAVSSLLSLKGGTVERTRTAFTVLAALFCATLGGPALAAQTAEDPTCESVAATLESGRWPTNREWVVLHHCRDLSRIGPAVGALVRRLPDAWRSDSARFDPVLAGVVRHDAVFDAAMGVARDPRASPGLKVAALEMIARQHMPRTGGLTRDLESCMNPLTAPSPVIWMHPRPMLDSARVRAAQELLRQMIREAHDEPLISAILCASIELATALPDALDPTAL
jgi:hypothetical protein